MAIKPEVLNKKLQELQNKNHNHKKGRIDEKYHGFQPTRPKDKLPAQPFDHTFSKINNGKITKPRKTGNSEYGNFKTSVPKAPNYTFSKTSF